jgi:hypothetical protein
VLGDSRYIERGLVTYISLSLSLSLDGRRRRRRRRWGRGFIRLIPYELRIQSGVPLEIMILIL